MDRRHQVFVSSTFTDLQIERAEIVQALLELDCFPAGMEMFPATYEGAWDLIKKVIDDSDYYCLVIGGRYGSTDPEGLSFTEKEYDYALASGKPLVAFLHAEPGSIPFDKSEKSQDTQEKLRKFREKVEANHHCKYWNNAEDLGGKVARAVIKIRKAHPSDGWIPGAFAEDEASRLERVTMKARIAELEAILLNNAGSHDGVEVENIASGDDLFNARVAYRTTDGKDESLDAPVSWDLLLRYVGPTLLAECSDEDLEGKIQLCFFHVLQQLRPKESLDYDGVIVPYVTSDQIKIQLRALGYMIPGVKRRAVSDRRQYWKLTAPGEKQLLSVQALKKPAPQEPLPLDKPS